MAWSKLADPASLPAGTGAAIAFNSDATICAVGLYAAPYIALYDTSTSPWTKLSDPADLPPGAVEDLDFSPDDAVLAVACYSNAPYHILYDTSDWSKMADLASPPPADASAVRFSPDGTYLAFAHYTAPCFAVYQTSDWSKLADPGVGMANDGNFVAWSPDSANIVVGTTFDDNTAVLGWYDAATWTRTLITAPDSDNAVWTGCFSPDGTKFAAASTNLLALYQTSDWSRLTDPGSQPATPSYYHLDYSDAALLVGYDFASPYLLAYDPADFTTPLSDPDTPPTGPVYGVRISPDGALAGAGHDASPYLTAYETVSDLNTIELDLEVPLPEFEATILSTGDIALDRTVPLPRFSALMGELVDIEQEWVLVDVSVLEQEWIFDARFLEFIEQEWVFSSDIRTVLEQEWVFDSPILDYDTLEIELVIVSPILGASAQIVTDVPTATIRGQVIPLESATVTTDEGQFAWTCQLTLTDPRHYNLFRPDDAFTVNLPGEDYAFIVDSVALAQGGPVDLSATVAGTGPAALYASPRAQKVSRTWDEAVLATAVVEELFGAGVVQWEILDWAIPAFRLGVQDQEPMEVLKRLAGAPRAIPQSDPDGTIRVRYLYPVSVPQYAEATPAQDYYDAPHTYTKSARQSSAQLVDKLRILDVEPGAGRDSIEFEQDKTRFTHGTLRVFPSPWRTDVRVEHTSDARVSAALVGEETEELTETVEVIGGKGSVAKPIFEVVELEWLFVDLSGVAFELDSTAFSTTHPTLTESLLRITYRTRFIEFEASAFPEAEVQFLVKEAA